MIDQIPLASAASKPKQSFFAVFRLSSCCYLTISCVLFSGKLQAHQQKVVVVSSAQMPSSLPAPITSYANIIQRSYPSGVIAQSSPRSGSQQYFSPRRDSREYITSQDYVTSREPVSQSQLPVHQQQGGYGQPYITQITQQSSRPMSTPAAHAYTPKSTSVASQYSKTVTMTAQYPKPYSAPAGERAVHYNKQLSAGTQAMTSQYGRHIATVTCTGRVMDHIVSITTTASNLTPQGTTLRPVLFGNYVYYRFKFEMLRSFI